MKQLIAAMLVLGLALVARADFRFIHASDTHFGVGQNHEINAQFFREISALDPKPAFVVVTGDICEIGTDEEYEQYRAAVKHLAVPIYNAPGNHDVRWNPRGKEGYTLGVSQPLFQSWDYENVHFVTLDSTVLLEHWGHISQQQLDWLKEDLAKVGPEKPVVIGFHHWIGRERVQVDNAAALLKVVEPYNVVLWLMGHGHSDIQWSINGTPAIMQKGLYQGSYATIDVNADSMVIRRRSWRDEKAKPDELVRDKSIPATQEALWKDVMTVPLKKPAAPKWDAVAKLEGGKIDIAVTGELPQNAKLEYRINSGNMQPLADDGTTTIDAAELVPGRHTITVQATLKDRRAYQRPIDVTIPGKIAPVWEKNVGGAVQSRLVLNNDTLLVTTMAGELVALDSASGAEKYRVKSGDSIFSAPEVDGQTIYFGSADHHVYAIDAGNGAVKWKTKTGGAVLAGPASAQGIVCVGSVDTKIYGLDANTGEVRWTVQGGNMFQSKTATDGERFFVGGWDNRFRCIEAKSGKVLWDLKLGKAQRAENFSQFAPAIASPSVGDGLAFISSNDGILHGLRIEDGKEMWKIDWKKMGYSSPVFRDGKVYCALSDEGKVFSVDAKTGEFAWQGETGSVIYDSSFALGGGRAFIGSVAGLLSAFDAKSGERRWQYRLGPGHVLASPGADDQRVYIGSMSGMITALPITGDNAAARAADPAAASAEGP